MTTPPRRSSRLADKAAERAFVAPAERRPRAARVPRSTSALAPTPLKDPIDEYLLLTFGSTTLRRRRFSHDDSD